MKKYWFFLYSHIYVSFKADIMLLYDTHKGLKIVTSSYEAIQIIRSLYNNINIGSIILNDEQISYPQVKDFIGKVISEGMGELVDENKNPLKPIILLPILSLNLDVEKFKNNKNEDILVGRDISKYLLDVNIFLNSFCQQECLQCHSYNKQFFCCSKSKNSEELTKESLDNLLRQISYFPLRTVNITGGNIYQYKHLNFFDFPSEENNKIFNFYVNYLNYESNSYIDKHTVHLIINTPIDYNKLRDCILLSKGKEVKYHVIIEDIEQYENINVALTKFGIKDYKVHPFYNGQNIRFFEENVYLSQEDIVTNIISMREIFRNQKLNANNFGSLYIFPNGEIKANINEATIGVLGENEILDVINNELLKNTAWRCVRSSKPCKDCVYQYLCPPPSNYEKVINRPNLCNVFKQ
jgi:hypothetical protein